MSAITAETMVNESTQVAAEETLLTPRFYTTDFDAMDRLDLSPVRKEWDALMDEFRNDTNKNHFKRDEQFAREIRELPPALREEFMGFLVRAVRRHQEGGQEPGCEGSHGVHGA